MKVQEEIKWIFLEFENGNESLSVTFLATLSQNTPLIAVDDF